MKKLSDADARLFACDCAEHALRLFPELFDPDPDLSDGPYYAIWCARRFAGGRTSEASMRLASDDVADIAEGLTGAAHHAAYAASFASEPGCPQVDMLDATMHAAVRAVMLAECDWQEAALQKYLEK